MITYLTTISQVHYLLNIINKLPLFNILKENLSSFFPWDLSVVQISPEWVKGPEQGKSNGRIAIFSLWTGRIHLDRLQNKCTNCKGVKKNTNFGQITEIQEKLDTTCK